VRLLFVSKLEKFTRRAEIFCQMSKFESNNAYFGDFEKTYFLDGIKKLENRWAKFIELEGDYVEK
jgi:hypothetical protein